MNPITEDDRKMISATSSIGNVVSGLVDERRAACRDFRYLWKDHRHDPLMGLETVRKMHLMGDVQSWIETGLKARLEFYGLISMNHVVLFEVFLDFLDACISEIAAPFWSDQTAHIQTTELAREQLFLVLQPYKEIQW